MRQEQIQAIIHRNSTPDNPTAIEFLALKRSEADGGYWQNVTGGVEPGETALQAVKREIHEEAGLTDLATITRLPVVFEFEHLGTQYREQVFAVEANPTEEVILSPDHTEARWLGYSAMQETLYWPNNRRALKAFKETKPHGSY